MLRLSLAVRCLSKRPAAAITGDVATQPLGRPRQKLVVNSNKQRVQRFEQWRRKQVRSRASHIIQKTAAIKESLATTTNARDVLMSQLADQIFSRGHEFHSTACNITYVPDGNPATPEIALIGRSEVGKTSLLRSLFRERRAVSRSNSVLRRDGVNFFSVGGGVFNIADVPGFGGTSVPWSTILQCAVLTRNFVRYRPNLKMIYYCMDVHPVHGVRIQDLDLLKFMAQEVPNFTIVLTKADKLVVQKGEHHETFLFNVNDVRKELLRNDIEHPVLVTSAIEMGGIDALRYDMVMNVVHSLPTEKLTLAEARRLSERLFTQDEIASIRPLFIPPSDERVAAMEWNVKAAEESRRAAALGTAASADEQNHIQSHTEAADASIERDASAVITAAAPTRCLATKPTPYQSLVRKLEYAPLMEYVHKTSPWRNPVLWPPNIVPTKHPRKNIVRCPEAPDNPYLTQAQFVAPRADMYMRRPNVGCRRHKEKGKYEADGEAYVNARFTIPHFPDIVDVKMLPLPWMFLGSREMYFEKGEAGKALGIRLARYAQRAHIDPLSDHPAPQFPQLAMEVRRLEHGMHGAAQQIPASSSETHNAQQETLPCRLVTVTSAKPDAANALPPVAHLRPRPLTSAQTV